MKMLASAVLFIALVAGGKFLFEHGFTSLDGLVQRAASMVLSDITVCTEDKWATKESYFGYFSVSLPCNTTEIPYEKFAGGYYSTLTTNGDEYGAVYVDFGEDSDKIDLRDLTDTGFMNMRNEIMKDLDASLVKKTPLSIKGHPGREYRMRLDDGRPMIWRAYYASPIFYIVYMVAEERPAPSALDERFFASFDLKPRPKSEKQIEEEKARALRAEQEKKMEQIMRARAEEDSAHRQRQKALDEQHREKQKAAASTFIGSQKSTDWHKQ